MHECVGTMLFYSYFKTLVGKEVVVELKNDLAISGTLHSVDQYLNIKLNNVHVVNEQKYPHMVGLLCAAAFAYEKHARLSLGMVGHLCIVCTAENVQCLPTDT